jgi:hypothetical protein
MAETRGSGHVRTLWLMRGQLAPGTQRHSAHAETLRLKRARRLCPALGHAGFGRSGARDLDSIG